MGKELCFDSEKQFNNFMRTMSDTYASTGNDGHLLWFSNSMKSKHISTMVQNQKPPREMPIRKYAPMKRKLFHNSTGTCFYNDNYSYKNKRWANIGFRFMVKQSSFIDRARAHLTLHCVTTKVVWVCECDDQWNSPKWSVKSNEFGLFFWNKLSITIELAKKNPVWMKWDTRARQVPSTITNWLVMISFSISHTWIVNKSLRTLTTKPASKV